MRVKASCRVIARIERGKDMQYLCVCVHVCAHLSRRPSEDITKEAGPHHEPDHTGTLVSSIQPPEL